MKKAIAFFDFDGTITTKDTLLEFIKFSRGRLRFCLGFLWNSPYLVGYKLKIISNQLAKEKILQFFFHNTSIEEFNEQCHLFSQNALPLLIRPKAMAEIERLQKSGTQIVIVSASPENWIGQWATARHIQLLASRLEISNGKITGKIIGKNCHGNEKVSRIQEAFDLSAFEEVFTYGDTRGDRPMLRLGTAAFFKPFR